MTNREGKFEDRGGDIEDRLIAIPEREKNTNRVGEEWKQRGRN